MIKLRNISFLILLTCSVVRAQLPPWTVIPTSNSQTIVIKTLDMTVSYDYSFSTIGDAVGVFYDQSGSWVCAGYLQLDGITNSFTIYGNDAVDNGFQNLEGFHLKYWRKSQNCIIDAPSAGMSNAQYSTGGSDTIQVLGAFPAIVQYPNNYYCKNNTTILPIPLQITNTSFANLSFNIQPAGFGGFDPGTGNIENFSVINSGNYTFTITTLDGKCLRNPSFPITVSERLSSSPNVPIIQPTCENPLGIIKLDTSSILNGTKPYSISLVNTSNNNALVSALGLFENLSTGNYQLIIQDKHMCADTITIPIIAPVIDCDHVGDVLAPLQNNSHSEVFLPWKGLTKIYNSQGQLIHSFTTPAVWDGKDQTGQYVPTGAYFIFTEGNKKKEITVVY